MGAGESRYDGTAPPLSGAAAREARVVCTLKLDVSLKIQFGDFHREPAEGGWPGGRGVYFIQACSGLGPCGSEASRALYRRALAAGLGALLPDAARAVLSTTAHLANHGDTYGRIQRLAEQACGANDNDPEAYTRMPWWLLLARTQAALLEPWLARANALLAPHALRVAAFSWPQLHTPPCNGHYEAFYHALQLYELQDPPPAPASAHAAPLCDELPRPTLAQVNPYAPTGEGKAPAKL